MYQLLNQPRGCSKKEHNPAEHVWTERITTARIILIWQERLNDHFYPKQAELMQSAADMWNYSAREGKAEVGEIKQKGERHTTAIGNRGCQHKLVHGLNCVGVALHTEGFNLSQSKQGRTITCRFFSLKASDIDVFMLFHGSMVSCTSGYLWPFASSEFTFNYGRGNVCKD